MAMGTQTLNMPLNRNEWFEDYDGLQTTFKRYDEVKDYIFDWTDSLDSGETISSASWSSDGPTINSSSNTTTTTTVTLTGSGKAEVTIITSNSRTLQAKFNWRASDGGVDDYAG